MPKRHQLTLFVPAAAADELEQVRRQYNPVQAGLIAAHVTLCREDELTDLEKVSLNLGAMQIEPVTIQFGDAMRFAGGNGVMLPGVGDNESFHLLRQMVLQGIIDHPRLHEPHLTLMHPRTSTCTDTIFERITRYSFPHSITFNTISLIVQQDAGPWALTAEWSLKRRSKL